MTPPTLFCAVPTRATARRSAVARGVQALLLGCLCQGVWSQTAPPGPPAAATTDAAAPALPEPTPEDVPLRLRKSGWLSPQPTGDAARALPTFLRGQAISGRPELDVQVEGLPQATERTERAELRRGDTVIRADRLDYWQPDDLAKARGNVYVNRRGNRFEGQQLELEVDAFHGFFTQPNYRFYKNEAYGKASRLDFISESQTVAHNADYTTCQRQPGPSWLPDWVLTATRLDMDHDEEVGKAQGAVLRFKGLPVLPFPGLSYPLSDKRKSGLLPPTVVMDSVSGLEVIQPYYFDIAPNRDATVSPMWMSKRGFNVGSEFRYLEPLYRGQARFDYMPNDSLRERARWGGNLVHNGILDANALGLGGLGINVNLNRVSDDNYWRDFPRATLALTQRLLPNDATLIWARGDYSAVLRTLKWQTIQDVSSPITPPYDRMPQLTGRFNRSDIGPGLDAAVETDFTQFSADKSLTFQPNAQRMYSRLQLTRPWQAPGWFVIPKALLNVSAYNFDEALSSTGSRSASRAVLTKSLDAGLVFERDTRYFGRAFVQTLEPRAFYVHTPYRDQSTLPLYDTGAADFNFATIYTENPYVGNDRIADVNMLTLGVTSRLLDPATGAEAMRLGLAQRLRFKDQRVTLPWEAPVTDRVSDILLGASVNWTRALTLDSTVQFNQHTNRSTRSVIGVRYNPGNYRTVSAAYRLQRDVSEQIDIGWQWPINDLWGDRGEDRGPGRGLGGNRWYSVGRINYSMADRKMVDTVVGLEYDACCWIGRVVLERLTRGGVTTPNTRILFQLEFVGFSRVGSSPLDSLKRNVPRYQLLREPMAAPSYFSQYD